MPSFADIRKEITSSDTPSAADQVRRKYLAELSKYTSRPTLLYAASFQAPGGLGSFHIDDVGAFMAALIGVTGNALDLVLHSPGGSAEAVAQIVQYLRPKFDTVRVIVPQNAMSAATMLACAADEIVMGRHSALGPIDPQLVMPTQGGRVAVSAQSIIDEFRQAQAAVNGGANPLLWIEKIRAYPLGFLVHCEQLINLSQTLVGDWLTSYMFAGDPQGPSRAQTIARWLSHNDNFKTHARPIGFDVARAKGLKVVRLEDDQDLQERVLSLFHATMATFMATPCVKLVENDNGKGRFVIVQGQPA